jgi:pimeloyl-ACP methyl ester carboxylesterase
MRYFVIFILTIVCKVGYGQTILYSSEVIEIRNIPDSVLLSGTLLMPQGDGPFPGVVLIAGTGKMDRDEAYNGHKTFQVLAEHLAKKGIASFRYDKRGVGLSTGDFISATLHDFSNDALTALQYIKNLPNIELAGFIGHSEGGKVAPMAALKSELCDFLVLMAAQGLPTDQTLLKQSELKMIARGKTKEEIKSQIDLEFQIWSALKTAKNQNEAEETIKKIISENIEKNYHLKNISSENLEARIDAEVSHFAQNLLFDEFKNYISSDFLKDLNCPVFAITGTKDLNVSYPDEILQVASLLMSNDKLESTIKVYPGLNHMFQKCETGLLEEMWQIEETIDPHVLNDISAWILNRN